MHAHPTSDDINYIMSGTGKAVCDGIEEILIPAPVIYAKKDPSTAS